MHTYIAGQLVVTGPERTVASHGSVRQPVPSCTGGTARWHLSVGASWMAHLSDGYITLADPG